MADSLCQHSIVLVSIWVATAWYKRATEQLLGKYYAAVYKVLCYPKALDGAIQICHTKRGAQGKRLLSITKIFWEEGTCYVLSNWSCGTGFVLWALADGPYCLTENLDRSSPWPGHSLAWVDKVVCRILGTWWQALPSSLVALHAIFSLRHLASGAWSRAFQVPFFPGKLWGMLWGHRGSSSPAFPFLGNAVPRLMKEAFG